MWKFCFIRDFRLSSILKRDENTKLSLENEREREKTKAFLESFVTITLSDIIY